jgi:TPR repeat protein
MAFPSRSERKPQTPDRAHAGMTPVASIADPALNEIAHSVQAHLRASAVAIAVEFDGHMTCRARAGVSAPDIGTPVQRDRGVTGECVSTGAVIRCDDARSDARVDAAVCEQLGIRSILLVPLLFRGKVIGVVEAFFPLRHGFDDAAVHSLQEAAKQIVGRVCGEGESPSEAAAPVPTTAAPVPQVEAPEKKVEEGVSEPAPEFHAHPEDAPMRVAIVLAVVVVLALVGILYTHYNRASGSPQRPAAAAQPNPSDELRRAAESGNASAEFKLAQAYKTGTGVAPDPQQASAWLLRSAEHGNPDAQLEWAQTLENSDVVQAYTWYVIAGQSGKAESDEAIHRLTPSLSAADIAQVRFNVGQKILDGHALGRDPVAAYVWFALAEWGGDANARVPMQQLESQLTRAELRDAKARASTWIRRHSAPAAQKQNPPATASR